MVPSGTEGGILTGERHAKDFPGSSTIVSLVRCASYTIPYLTANC